jgi:hypothetical protein
MPSEKNVVGKGGLLPFKSQCEKVKEAKGKMVGQVIKDLLGK